MPVMLQSMSPQDISVRHSEAQACTTPSDLGGLKRTMKGSQVVFNCGQGKDPDIN